MILKFVGVKNISLPLPMGGSPSITGTINYSVNWGDNIINNNENNHTYNAETGNYTVNITLLTGTIDTFFVSTGFWSGSHELTEITDWGEWPGLTKLNLQNCFRLSHLPSNLPISIRNMSAMFFSVSNFNQDLNTWDVSRVENMTAMFNGLVNFDGNVSWGDIGEVTSMKNMFEGASSFNQPLIWTDISKVKTMNGMFRNATKFNQPLNWDVSKVEDMIQMFEGATKFNQLLNWNVGLVEAMDSMFRGASSFNQPLDWDVGKVKDMGQMFQGATSFNQPLDWDVALVIRMDEMFQGATSFNQPLDWNVGEVENMTAMFQGATKFNQDLSGWDVRKVSFMRNMFTDATSFTATNYGNTLIGWAAQDVKDGVALGGRPFVASQAALDAVVTLQAKGWTFTPVPTLLPPPMILEFAGVATITLPLIDLVGTIEVDWGDGQSNVFLSNDLLTHDYAAQDDYIVKIWLVPGGTIGVFGSLGWVGSAQLEVITQWGEWPGLLNLNFLGGAALIGVPPTLPTTVRSVAAMFFQATSFDQNISGWVVDEVIDMNNMFAHASSFNKDISGWVVSKVENMNNMFALATNFDQDIRDWDVGKVENMTGMFTNATSFNQPLNWDVRKVIDMSAMFFNATSFNQDLSAWNVREVLNMSIMFTDATSLSATNYGNTLIGWVALSDPKAQEEVTLGGRPFVASEAALTAYNTLIGNEYLWNITPVPTLLPPPMILKFKDVSTITLPLIDLVGTIEVDWGDDTSDNLFEHNYATPDDYTVQIWLVPGGTIGGFGEFGWVGSAQLRAITQWGEWPGLINLIFLGGAALITVPTTLPSTVRSVGGMFFQATSFNQDISGWVVDEVIDMLGMFNGATSFNQNISGWVVGEVENMEGMFNNATSFNQDLSAWNVRKVLIMTGMFSGATRFTPTNYGKTLIGWVALSNPIVKTGVSLGGRPFVASEAALTAYNTLIGNEYLWNITPEPTVLPPPMILKFKDVSTITLPLIDLVGTIEIDWGDDTSDNLFEHNYAIPGDYTVEIALVVGGTIGGFGGGEGQWIGSAQLTAITQWGDWPDLTTLRLIGGAALISVPTTLPSTIRNVVGMFADATSFNQPLDWDVGQVIDMFGMFFGATKFNQDLSGWDVRQVSNMSDMFTGATSFTATNYGNTLIGWAAQDVKLNVSLAGRPFVASQAGLNAFVILDAKDWSFTPEPTLLPPPMILEFTGVATIRLPLINLVGTIEVDWGDDTSDNLFEHNYAIPDDYTVQIWLVPGGTIGGFGSANWVGSVQLEAITQWGEWPGLLNLNFLGGAALIGVPPTLPTTVRSVAAMFFQATSFNQDISGWDVGEVQSMGGMFFDATSFNQDISGWIVSEVTNMIGMFNNATSFNQPLDWDVSQVEFMDIMFQNATSFNQDLSAWDVRLVSTMADMFTGAISFTATNYGNTLIGWAAQDVKLNVSLGGRPFVASQAAFTAFETLSTKGWTFTPEPTLLPPPMILEFTDVATMTLPLIDLVGTIEVDWGDDTSDNLFEHNYAIPDDYTVQIWLVPGGTIGGFGSVNWVGSAQLEVITQWGEWPGLLNLNFLGGAALIRVPTTLPTTVRSVFTMFANATSFNQDISGWIVSEVTNMIGMFFDATSFNQDISGWIVSEVTNMRSMFRGASSFNQPLDWDVSKVEDMFDMFRDATSFNQPLDWDINSQVSVDMGSMFRGASSFNQPLDWDVGKVRLMDRMFRGATSFNQDLSAWNVSQVTDMFAMFTDATSFTATNYGNTLIGWAALDVVQPHNLSGRPFVASQAAFDAFETLKTKGWIFTPEPTLLPPPMILEFANVATMRLPLFGFLVETIEVDWGDGQSNIVLSNALLTHDYAAQDDYIVKIWLVPGGTITGFGSLGWVGSAQLTEITQWGDWPGLINLNFLGGAALTSVPTTLPSTVRNVASMFSDATSFNQNISGWDVDEVIVMNSMFNGATIFNQDLSGWNVSEVTTMSDMFTDATSFTSTNYGNTLIGWAAQDVKDGVALGGRPFVASQAALEAVVTLQAKDWDITPVPTLPPPMVLKFTDIATITLPLFGLNFTVLVDWGDGQSNNSLTHDYAPRDDYTVQISLIDGTLTGFGFNGWVGSAQLMEITQWGEWPGLINLNFLGGAALIAVPPTLPSTVRNVRNMFANASSFNQDLITWDVGLVENMFGMFDHATSFDANISTWDVREVKNMEFMFGFATNFNQPLNWIVSKVENMVNMFFGATNFDKPLNWDVGEVKDMHGMFVDAVSFDKPLNWNVSKVEDMAGMFFGATEFDQPLNWNVSGVKNMSNMFVRAINFNQPLVWDVGLVENMSAMFADASKFNRPLDWDVKNVTDMTDMFHDATSFNQDLSRWDVRKVSTMTDMFTDATSFNATNYGNTLIGWAAQDVKLNVSLGGRPFVASQAGLDAFVILDAKDWTFTPEPTLAVQYQPNVYTFPINTAITDIPPTVGAGITVSAYTISPPLPNGLSFATGTGIISGTPTAASSQSYSIIATYNGGQTTSTPLTITTVIPIQYQPNVYTFPINTAITDIPPTVGAGITVNGYTISPPLPNGLSFANGTGIISGTPTAASSQSYSIIATYNVNQTFSTPLTITTIIPVQYQPSVYTFPINTAISNITPTVGAGITVSGYTISQPLPSGLSFAAGTGIISGTPTAASNQSYSITATYNGTQTFSTPLTITTIIPVQYQPNVYTFPINTAISNITPIVDTGITVSGYTISPPLPSGLSFATGTGIISGTPTAASSQSYSIIATYNVNQTFSTPLTITTIIPIQYQPNVYTFPINTAISNITPIVGTGITVSGYTISQPLPSGLSFATGTGIISGTPTAASNSQTYSITATYNGGQTFSTPITMNVRQPMILKFVNVQKITLPLTGSPIIISVNWGDNTIDALTTHTYANKGSYTVQIALVDGIITGFGSFDWLGSIELTEITQWGEWPGLTHLNFLGDAALTKVPTTLPSTVRNVANMFRNASTFNQDLSEWNVSEVQDMGGMFIDATVFNQPLNGWNVGKVENMVDMFSGATSFSASNYGNTLIGWANLQIVQLNVPLRGRPFVASQAALDAVVILKTKGWTITPEPTLLPPMILKFALQSANVKTITLPLTDLTGTVSVNWGDNTIDALTTHTYASVGNYTVQITLLTGTISGFGSLDWVGSAQLTEITQWGEWPGLTHLNFLGKAALMSVPTTLPITVRNLDNMFANASSFNQDLSTWDVSQVLTMDSMLTGATSFSASNYDKTLIGWAAQPVTQNVRLGGRPYVATQAGLDAYVKLTSNLYRWIITPVPKIPMILEFTGVSTITLPLIGVSIFVSVDWGDGLPSNNSLTHTYAAAGNYTVHIVLVDGFIFKFGSVGWVGSAKLTAITQWGTWPGLTTLNFLGGALLTSVPNNLPSTVTNIDDMFIGAIIFNDVNISQWNVSEITSMNTLFSGAKIFDQPLNNWNVRKVLSMSGLFFGAEAFNQDINLWNVSAVIDMSSMFFQAKAFNKPIGFWNVSAVTNMSSMFNEATAFNQDISNWKVILVRNMSNMFKSAIAFDKDISRWNVSAVTTMTSMFHSATVFNQDISQWNVSAVTAMSSMFRSARAFNQTLQFWNVSNVATMGSMFEDALNFDFFNYGQSLIGWAAVANLKQSVSISSGDGNLIISTSRDNTDQNKIFLWQNNVFKALAKLRTTFNWTITINTLFFDQPLVSYGDPFIYPLFCEYNRPTNRVYFKGKTILPYKPSLNIDFAFTNTKFSSSLLPSGLNIDNTTGSITGTPTSSSPLTNYLIACVIEGADNFIFAPINYGQVNRTNSRSNTIEISITVVGPMILRFQTTTANTVITLPLTGESPPDIDWGDESKTQTTNSHTYLTAGTYTVQIYSKVTGFGSSGWIGSANLVSIEAWGDLNLLTKLNFLGGALLTSVPTTLPSTVSDVSDMFSGASTFNQDLSTWDVSKVTNMSGMFRSAVIFNQDLSTWDVSKVTNMRAMFSNAPMFNSNINKWDVSKVTDMASMFSTASTFNQDLSTWNVSQVTVMNGMFIGAFAFNQDISHWDVSKVTSMDFMFSNSSFNQDLSKWNVSQVQFNNTNSGGMLGMFGAVPAFDVLNYSTTLIGWAKLTNLFRNIKLDGGSRIYDAALPAYTTLRTSFRWSITPGLNTNPSLNVVDLSNVLLAVEYNEPKTRIYSAGTTIVPYSPAFLSYNNALVTFTINKTPPAGLQFDTTNGTFSGTPTSQSSATDYIITATRSDTNTTVQNTVNLAVIETRGIVYNPSSYTFLNGVRITTTGRPTVPSGTTILNYAISAPALPAGLTFNTTDGTISGTPTSTILNQLYTITATTSTQSTLTGPLTLSVTDITYTPVNFTFIANVAITPIQPVITPASASLGTVRYLLAPDAIGLTINGSGTITGAILRSGTGTPGAFGININAFGYSKTVRITYTASDLSYNPLIYNFIQGTPIIQISPSINVVSPGAAITFSPPAGLAIDASGNITGTPLIESTGNYPLTLSVPNVLLPQTPYTKTNVFHFTISSTSNLMVLQLSGVSTGSAVSLPLIGLSATYQVNWDATNPNSSFENNQLSHTYTNAGTADYLVYISISSGTLSGFGSENWPGSQNLRSILQWGNLPEIKNLNYIGGTRLISVPSDLPSTVTSLAHTFEGSTEFNWPIATWNVSKVEDTSYMLSGAAKYDKSLDPWNVETVKKADYMFRGTSYNQANPNWEPTNMASAVGMYGINF